MVGHGKDLGGERQNIRASGDFALVVYQHRGRCHPTDAKRYIPLAAPIKCNPLVRGSVFKRTNESGAGPSRYRPPRSAQDRAPSNEDLPRYRVAGPSTWDTERRGPMPRPNA